jgi:hypothetical protein
MTNGLVDWMRVVKTTLTLVVIVFGLGQAYALLEQRIENKADKAEVTALRNELQFISREIRTIRLMLCDGAPADSYCRSIP